MKPSAYGSDVSQGQLFLSGRGNFPKVTRLKRHGRGGKSLKLSIFRLFWGKFGSIFLYAEKQQAKTYEIYKKQSFGYAKDAGFDCTIH